MNKVLKIKVQNFKAFSVKADTETGIIEAYVSIFGNVDLAGEVVDKGAFAESLAKKLPKVVWSHDWQQPIGVVLEAREDEKGLYCKFQLTKGVQKADEALLLMQAEGGDGRPAIDEFSIGYAVQEDYFGDDGFRHLKKIRLYEVSPVLVGCNQETELLSAKGTDGVLRIGVGITKEIEHEEEIQTEEQKPKEGEGEEGKGKKEEGDPCEMEDGTEGEMHPNEEGNLVCMPKKSAPQEEQKTEPAPEEKEGRVLSGKNRELVQKAVEDADNLISSLKLLVSPLRDLLEATEPAKGGKVEPTDGESKTILRIRQSAKQVIKDSQFILRITK